MNNTLIDETAQGMSALHGAEVIHRVTRAELIEDGALIDLTERARENGFVIPLAITAALEADLRNIPESRIGIESYEGRLHDLLHMAAAATKGRIPRNIKYLPIGQQIDFFFYLPVRGSRKRNYAVKMIVGPGDTPAPVLTLLRPNED